MARNTKNVGNLLKIMQYSIKLAYNQYNGNSETLTRPVISVKSAKGTVFAKGRDCMTTTETCAFLKIITEQNMDK